MLGVEGRDIWPSLPRTAGVEGREDDPDSSTLNLTREVMRYVRESLNDTHLQWESRPFVRGLHIAHTSCLDLSEGC